MTDPAPRIGPAKSFGWMRRGDLEDEHLAKVVWVGAPMKVEIWEKPDGQLHLHDPKQGPLMVATLDDPMGIKGKRIL